MTNNIEKLYELAGVEKYYLYTVKHLGKIHIAPLEGILENLHLFKRNKKSKVKNTYINRVKKVYPPFTDTKQLELILWISLNTRYMWNYIGQTVKNTWVLAIDYTQIFKFKSCEHTDFSQALAGLVCELWEDLTDTQKEEIRKVLE